MCRDGYYKVAKKKNLLCKILGHNMFLVVEIDNGYSKYGEHKCSRCGMSEEFQFDYN